MDWIDLLGLAAGFALAVVTTPVGVSGAVFLLPIQLSALHVPSPQLTPTNLLFNVVSAPGGLTRYRRRGQIDRDLALVLSSGAVPGVAAGAVLRVYVVADLDTFRLLAAAVLVPVGLLILRAPRPRSLPFEPRPATLRILALAVGVVGGLYGVGGGSVLAPVLVGLGMSITRVGPAALACTWATSIVGVLTYALIALDATGPVAPDWSLGLAAGLGGLLGGWCGAALQPHLPERALRLLLGMLALALGGLYLVQTLT